MAFIYRIVCHNTVRSVLCAELADWIMLQPATLKNIANIKTKQNKEHTHTDTHSPFRLYQMDCLKHTIVHPKYSVKLYRYFKEETIFVHI